MASLIGQYLGDYYINEHLGAGGYADVYRCFHKDRKTEHAIKVIQQPASDENKQLFRNEILLHSQLKHPSIVQTSDWDRQQYQFLVMDYAPFGSLSRLGGQQVELSIVLPYIKQLADALDYIHQKNIIHCDVKPDNFLLQANNTVLLSDFGIAVTVNQSITSVYGTLEYVSPEQMSRKPGPASDQYSLAITVYEWLTGEYPFDNSYDILHRASPSLRQKVPHLPQEAEDVVLKALAKQPQDRYPNVTAFVAELEQTYLRTQPTSPGTSSTQPPSVQAITNQTRRLYPPVNTTSLPSNATQRLYGPVHGQQSVYVYRNHLSEVVALTWSPDGKRIASAGLDNVIHIWDALDGDHDVTQQGFSHMILNLLWSPDDQCLAVADEVQMVQFWDNKTQKKLFRYQHRVGKPDEVGIGLYYPMVWSHDGQFMISASDDQPLEKWNTTTGQRLLTYTGHTGQVNAIAWSVDETVVASGGADTTVHIWDAIRGDTQFVYTGHRGKIRALSWSPGGKRIASAGSDGRVHIWNANDGGNLLTYNNHRLRAITTMAWSPDGTKVASAGEDKRVCVWNPINGQTLAVYTEHTESVTRIAWSPDGEYLASASNDGTVRVWHINF